MVWILKNYSKSRFTKFFNKFWSFWNENSRSLTNIFHNDWIWTSLSFVCSSGFIVYERQLFWIILKWKYCKFSFHFQKGNLFRSIENKSMKMLPCKVKPLILIFNFFTFSSEAGSLWKFSLKLLRSFKFYKQNLLKPYFVILFHLRQ